MRASPFVPLSTQKKGGTMNEWGKGVEGEKKKKSKPSNRPFPPVNTSLTPRKRRKGGKKKGIRKRGE